MALSLSFRLALPVTLVLVALTPLQTQATCLDDYLASIRNAQATGDYSHYAQLAAVYTSCLAGGGGAASAASDITALAMAQATAVGSPGCLGPYLAGIYAAGASGDYTQYAKLAAMYTACLAGGGTAAGATSTASAAAAAGTRVQSFRSACISLQ